MARQSSFYLPTSGSGPRPERPSHTSARWPPPTGDHQPIPAGAYNVGAQLRANEDGVDSHPPRARVHLGQGVWLTLRAARIVEDDEVDADIAVTLEPTSTNERTALFSLAHGLSKREAEIVAAWARGMDTRGLAQGLFVSENTIQDHLKSIFAKTRTRTCAELLAIARGR
jgi:DNA-binding CsgD family transcriptional regulator